MKLRDHHTSENPTQNGFTLIEMLVALSLFSLAALALVRLQGTTTQSTGRLEEQLYSQITANNLAALALSDPLAPAIGTTQGEILNGGRELSWQREVTLIDEGRLLRININVSGPLRVPANIVAVRVARQ